MGLGEASKVLQVVFKQTGGLVWKNWPMNRTRRANARKRTIRVHRIESILKACSAVPSEPISKVSTKLDDSKMNEVHPES